MFFLKIIILQVLGYSILGEICSCIEGLGTLYNLSGQVGALGTLSQHCSRIWFRLEEKGPGVRYSNEVLLI